uniref:Uncharacterized protein n=1 Tax=Rhizophora mucronata TaxID=61149 RepID=A0A2P2QES4_RHIMU
MTQLYKSILEKLKLGQSNKKPSIIHHFYFA